ncbi:MAG: phage tail protein [Pirellulales bacterium]
MTVFSWSQTAASNATADSSINWREGQAPSQVNDSARAMMSAIAKWRDDMSGNLVTGGSSTAFTITSNQTFTALTDGITIKARMSATNGASPTLNVDSLGAKSIATLYGAAVPTRSLLSGSVQTFTYDSTDDKWIVHGSPGATKYIGEIFDYGGTTAPALCVMCYGQAISRTTYADLYAVIGTTYGTGDGSTTFNVPDLRGRVVAGKDDMGGSSANRLTDQTGGLDGDTLGDTGGSETHQLTEAELAAHTHGDGTYATSTDGDHTHFLVGNATSNQALSDTNYIAKRTDQNSGNNDATLQGTATAPTYGISSTDGDHSHDVTGASGSTGSDTAHNNVQPTIILNKCIFAGA